MDLDVEYAELARAESELGELVLRRRRREAGPSVLELRVNGVPVRDSRDVGVDLAFVNTALAEVAEVRSVVVGGLGLGFPVREVLTDPRVERVAVVESDEALVRWMRDGTIPHGPGVLADDRVHLVLADIEVAFAEARPAAYDVVLLEAGERLLQRALLEAVKTTLRPGGVLAMCADSASPEVAHALRGVFGDCEQRTLRDFEEQREATLYLARA